MDYIRKILYLNEYDGGTPGKNIGFLKLAKKGTRLRIEISLSEEKPIKGERIYLLYRDRSAVNKVFVGTITENSREIRLSESMGDDGETWGELAGVVIGSEGRVVCAGMEDNDLNVMDYVGAQKQRPEEKTLPNEEELSAGEEGPEEKILPNEEELSAEEERPEEPAPSDRQTGQSPREPEPDGEGEMIRVEVEEEHDMAYALRKIFATHDNMYPFEDDEFEECVQISPADFSDLGKEYWQMGSNTFLLQGYYNYRHLIMARKGESVLIGIPGQYHRRDQYLAKMFGFGRFKSIMKKTGGLGDFGYWMKEIAVLSASDREDMICAVK